MTCPSCGEPTYRAWTEWFGATGSLHSFVQYRHESTGHTTCPRLENRP